MGLFRKKTDPISDRARALKNEIAALEAQIHRLDSQLAQKGPSGSLPPKEATAPTPPPSHEPIFEDIDLGRLESTVGQPAPREHFNELGVRKYDLLALISRIKNHVRGPATSNPKLVSYLAAGGIQGLSPMRYEKRVARNRFIALVVVLFLIMLGIVAVFVKG